MQDWPSELYHLQSFLLASGHSRIRSLEEVDPEVDIVEFHGPVVSVRFVRDMGDWMLYVARAGSAPQEWRDPSVVGEFLGVPRAERIISAEQQATFILQSWDGIRRLFSGTRPGETDRALDDLELEILLRKFPELRSDADML